MAGKNLATSTNKTQNLVRTFLAIPLNAQTAMKVDNRIRQLKTALVKSTSVAKTTTKYQIRWLKPEKQHITLRFLGNIKPQLINHLISALENAISGSECQPFSICLAKLILLPSKRKPRVIAIEIAENLKLAHLAKKIETAVTSCGLEPALRPFRGHLTIGRVKFGKLVQMPAINGCDMDVNKFVLYRSDLNNQGSIYTKLHTFFIEKLQQ